MDQNRAALANPAAIIEKAKTIGILLFGSDNEPDDSDEERVARELIRIARKLMFDKEVLFVPDHLDDELINSIVLESGEVIDNLANKNHVEYRLGTRVKGRVLELSIGVDDHPNKAKMLRAFEVATRMIGKEYGVRVV